MWRPALGHNDRMEAELISTRAIAERVSQGKVRISHVTVAAILKEVRNEPSQQPLPLEGQAVLEPMATSVATAVWCRAT